MSSPRRPDLSPTGAALLGLLALRPWTTYELATQAGRSLRWFWPRAERKLYAEPKLLVELGYATATPHATGRRPSTRYAITRKGRAELARWLARDGGRPTFESEELIRVFFADNGTPGQLSASVERMRAGAVGAMTELAEIGATPAGVDEAITRRASVNALSFALVFRVHEAIATWAEWAGREVTGWQRTDEPEWGGAEAVFANAIRTARHHGGNPQIPGQAELGGTSADGRGGRRPTLLVVVAHPDDETFGCGSLLALAHERGAHTVVCCASRGEAGEDASGACASASELARRREAELRHAAELLGVDEVEILGFADSGWDGSPPAGSIVGVEPAVLTAAMGAVIDRHRPDVVVTMDPGGSDGHRDHAAIGRASTDAFAQTVTWGASLYHWCLPHSLMDAWSKHTAASDPDSVYLETELGRADADITTRLAHDHLLDLRRAAIAAHATQTSPFAGLTEELERAFLGEDHLVRVVPAWTGGPVENALAGLG